VTTLIRGQDDRQIRKGKRQVMLLMMTKHHITPTESDPSTDVRHHP